MYVRICKHVLNTYVSYSVLCTVVLYPYGVQVCTCVRICIVHIHLTLSPYDTGLDQA